MTQTFELKYQGIKTNKDGWPHFSWIATINGVDFNYSTGLGHSKHLETVKYGMIDQHSYFTKKECPTGYIRQDFRSLSNELQNDILKAFNLKRVMWNVERLSSVFVKKPKLREILYSLAQDAQAGQQTFESFCNELGYNSDSRSHFDIYMQCQDISSKFNRLFKSRNAMNRILSWEL